MFQLTISSTAVKNATLSLDLDHTISRRIGWPGGVGDGGKSGTVLASAALKSCRYCPSPRASPEARDTVGLLTLPQFQEWAGHSARAINLERGGWRGQVSEPRVTSASSVRALGLTIITSR